MTTPRRALLLQAADTIDGDRNETYGKPESSFRTIAALWNEYLRVVPPVPGDVIRPHDVAAMLALLKIARIAASGGTHKDSWLDLAGYAACGWETVDVPVPVDMEPAQDPCAKVFAPDPSINAEALKKIQEELQGLRPIGPGTLTPEMRNKAFQENCELAAQALEGSLLHGWQGVK